MLSSNFTPKFYPYTVFRQSHPLPQGALVCPSPVDDCIVYYKTGGVRGDNSIVYGFCAQAARWTVHANTVSWRILSYFIKSLVLALHVCRFFWPLTSQVLGHFFFMKTLWGHEDLRMKPPLLSSDHRAKSILEGLLTLRIVSDKRRTSINIALTSDPSCAK